MTYAIQITIHDEVGIQIGATQPVTRYFPEGFSPHKGDIIELKDFGRLTVDRVEHFIDYEAQHRITTIRCLA